MAGNDFISVERCPICGGEGEHWKSEAENGFSISTDKCLKCGVIYQNPRMSDHALREWYQSGRYHDDYPANFNWESKRADRIIMLLERFKIAPKNCLDIGSGSGILLKHLEIFNFARVIGLEPNPTLSKVEEVVHSKEEIQGDYDLITCIHVLEHMPDPKKEIEWMMSKLKEGGTLLLELPTDGTISLPHLFVFDKKSLELMLNDLGLKYLYIDHGTRCQILVGEQFEKYTTSKVYYSFESPDFDTIQEYSKWLQNTYDAYNS